MDKKMPYTDLRVDVTVHLGWEDELYIPEKVAEQLGWASGDLVRLRIDDGVIYITKVEQEE